MNKAELTAAIVKKTGFTKKDAEKALGAVTESITEALASGEKVQVVGFGSFEVRKRPARVARNPRTGEQIKIAASKAPVFKAGKALKDSVTEATLTLNLNLSGATKVAVLYTPKHAATGEPNDSYNDIYGTWDITDAIKDSIPTA